MIDVAIAIDAEAIDVTRKTPGGAYDAEGFWVAIDPAPATIRATIQPTSARELKDMPEGVRSEAIYTMRTRVAVNEGDVIGYGGKDWRVLKSARWSTYTKAWLGLLA